jgi:putative ABC transport system substrate-binding protein
MLALAVALTPPFAEAQQTTKVYRIGFLGLSSATDYAPYLESFRRGLRDLGHEEGRNIVIDYRWAQGKVDRLPGLAAERSPPISPSSSPPSSSW